MVKFISHTGLHERADLIKILCLSENPDQLGNGGLRRHIANRKNSDIQQVFAYLIDLQINAVVNALCYDENRNPAFPDQLLQLGNSASKCFVLEEAGCRILLAVGRG